MKVQRPLVIIQGKPMLYSSFVIKHGRRYIDVNGKTICMGTTEDPAFVPEFKVVERNGVDGWAGAAFFKESTRRSGRQVFEF